MQSFDVYLPSNTVEGNKTNSFVTRLPQELQFNSRWQCGLVSISYPRTWRSLRTNCISINLINREEQEQILIEKINIEKPGDIVEMINRKIEQYVKDKNLAAKNDESFFAETDNFIKVIYDKKAGLFVFKLHPSITSITLSPQLQYVLGFKNSTVTQMEAKASFAPDLSAGSNILFVYCPLIEPVICGSVKCPLLRTITVKGQPGEYVEENFQNIQYRDLVSKKISEIELEIRTGDGELCKFEHGTCMAVLNFRKQPLL